MLKVLAFSCEEVACKLTAVMSVLHWQAGWHKQLVTLSLLSMKVKPGKNDMCTMYMIQFTASCMVLNINECE